MEITTFDALYHASLSDLHSAEAQLVKALPKISGAVTSPKLKTAINDHLEVTKSQLDRLGKVFKMLEEKPSGEKCAAMEGIIKEGDKVIEEMKEGPIRDAAIIGAAQRAEHYEISGYGTACAFAMELGYQDQLEILQEILDEESEANTLLTRVAQSDINKAAVMIRDKTAQAKSTNGSTAARTKVGATSNK